MSRNSSTAMPLQSARTPESVDSVARLIRTTAAAKRVGISPESLRKYVIRGLIPAVRVGPKLLMFDPIELDKLAQRIDNAS